mmetsp:Transcript_19372/g.39607  ORF Transcript_19372/g.39607 Transcript_19372/m.39607 type:complete len:85 (+) Transcript_19372:529-783(+)
MCHSSAASAAVDGVTGISISTAVASSATALSTSDAASPAPFHDYHAHPPPSTSILTLNPHSQRRSLRKALPPPPTGPCCASVLA